MSLHDGDGIRTTIFFKGCDLHCRWCHNPETLFIRPELEWIENKCIGCGVCLRACPQKALKLDKGRVVRSEELCKECLTCCNACYAEAHHCIGELYTVEELCAKVEMDRTVFVQSGGGVTISGGEPMMQYSFLKELLRALTEKQYNICLQTNLTSNWAKYRALLPYVDLFMCDFKHIDTDKHFYWTGKGNEKILENINNLDRSGAAYCLRTPVVPGVNDSDEVLCRMRDFVSRLKNIKRYELLAFHPLASYKYNNLGMEYEFESAPEMSKEKLQQLKNKYELTQ